MLGLLWSNKEWMAFNRFEFIYPPIDLNGMKDDDKSYIWWQPFDLKRPSAINGTVNYRNSSRCVEVETKLRWVGSFARFSIQFFGFGQYHYYIGIRCLKVYNFPKENSSWHLWMNVMNFVMTWRQKPKSIFWCPFLKNFNPIGPNWANDGQKPNLIELFAQLNKWLTA